MTRRMGALLVRVQTSFLANNTFVLTKALVAGLGLGAVCALLKPKMLAFGGHWPKPPV